MRYSFKLSRMLERLRGKLEEALGGVRFLSLFFSTSHPPTVVVFDLTPVHLS
jgi:hypothetical protein